MGKKPKGQQSAGTSEKEVTGISSASQITLLRLE